MPSTLKRFFTSRKIISHILVLICCAISNAQDSLDNNKSLESFYQTITTIYGSNQVLVNGEYNDFSTIHDLGHPYYRENAYKDSYIIIRGQKFENIKLKYDLFHQNVIIIDNAQISQTSFCPPISFIEEFTYGKSLFRKYSFESYPDKFYQVIYENKIKCLYSWNKKRSNSDHNFNFSAYSYHDQIKESYIVIEDTLIKYSNKSQFLSCFSVEYKTEIKHYLSSNKIKLKKANNATILELIKYCESLMSVIKTKG